MIGVIGLGFVGLTTALGFAHKGYRVRGFDSDLKRTKEISSGTIPFHEPGLEKALISQKGKRFIICKDLETLVVNSRIIFYCVGTPAGRSNNIDLKPLCGAVRESLRIIKKHKGFRTLVIKSSIPPSITQQVINPIIKSFGLAVGKDIGLTNNPEFLREGHAWSDFIKPDRIVIGQVDKASGEAVEKIYRKFSCPIFRVSLNTAEFIKYLSNSMLSNMISFSNEMAMVANAVGNIDIPRAFHILHLDKRWFGAPAPMASYMYPGCGFGGYCLPKDTWAVKNIAEKKGYRANLLMEVLRVNKKIKEYFVNQVCSANPRTARIGILGLSFKPGSDDVRESPAKDIIKLLLGKGFLKISAYDPMAVENFKTKYALPIEYARTLKEIVRNSDVLLVLTAWPVFRNKRSLLCKKKVYDGRYILWK